MHRELGVLRNLYDLVEMRVEGLCDSDIFHTIVILAAEVKNTLSSLIIKVNHLGILS